MNAPEQLIATDHTPAQVLPKNFLRPCLLLLLREQPAHGYDLLERLRPLGFARDDPGRLYRTLRALEREGLVERAPDPADRRLVRLRATPEGERVLHEGRRRRVARLAAAVASLDAEERGRLAEATELLERILDREPC